MKKYTISQNIRMIISTELLNLAFKVLPNCEQKDNLGKMLYEYHMWVIKMEGLTY